MNKEGTAKMNIETQSAFVTGRQITDNVLITKDIFHSLRTEPGEEIKEWQ